MIFFIIIICIIIILGIKNYKVTQEDKRREEYIKKQEDIERQENIRKQENLRKQEHIRQKEYIKQQETYYPYHKKYLLTPNEYYFYKKLKSITEPLNLQILAKIRIADLIEVNKGLSPSEWGKYFGKIKAKHIDFAIADDMKIVLIIELDDRTHQKQDRIKRDMFVDDALSQTGYTIIRTYGDIQQIKSFLESSKIRA